VKVILPEHCAKTKTELTIGTSFDAAMSTETFHEKHVSTLPVLSSVWSGNRFGFGQIRPSDAYHKSGIWNL
jgi:hypothetical protein